MVRRFLFTLLMLYFSSPCYGQETLLYEYNNITNTALGNNQYVLAWEIARPYKIVKKNGKIYNVSRNDTISYSLNIDLNTKYKGKSKNGSWHDELENVDIDSIEYTIDTNYDIGVVADTVFFKKNGKVEMRMVHTGNWYDKDDKKASLLSVSKKDKTIILKFDRKVIKTQSTEWSWQPGAAEGKSTYVRETQPDNAYQDAATIVNVTSAVPAIDYLGLTEFTGIEDTLQAISATKLVIISSIIEMTFAAYSNALGMFLAANQDTFSETVTWNIKPDTINGLSSNILFIGDTVGAKHRYDVTEHTDSIYTNTTVNNGFTFNMYPINASAGWQYHSDDAVTPTDRPKQYVHYTLEVTRAGKQYLVEDGVKQLLTGKDGVKKPIVRH